MSGVRSLLASLIGRRDFAFARRVRQSIHDKKAPNEQGNDERYIPHHAASPARATPARSKGSRRVLPSLSTM